MADEKGGADLPLGNVKRVVKQKLAELSGGDEKREVSVQKEALQALAEAAKIFIHFLTATANEVCHESKRLTISASDVLQALEEVDFPEYVQPLKEALAAYKAANAAAAAQKTETKKRKAAEAADAAGAGAEKEAAGPAEAEEA